MGPTLRTRLFWRHGTSTCDSKYKPCMVKVLCGKSQLFALIFCVEVCEMYWKDDRASMKVIG
jgi:hypothetical protein